MKISTTFRRLNLAAASIAALILWFAGAISPADAGKLLDQCNNTIRSGTDDQQAVSLVNCYVDKMREINEERDYIVRLEQAGIRIRGARIKGTGEIYRDCGLIHKNL